MVSSLQCFLFHHPSTTEISPLSLHDALPICARSRDEGHALCGSAADVDHRVARRDHSAHRGKRHRLLVAELLEDRARRQDRKSTRLNSSHRCISYAVFCLKKKNKTKDVC